MSDRYEIEDLVEQDESGVTFRARDRQEDQAVALRRFFPATSSGGGFQGAEITAFAGTVEALKKLRHPSLRGVLDGGVDEVDGIPYLVTEWAEGERLAVMLEAGALAPEQAVAIAGQCLEVLEVLQKTFGEAAEWLEMEAGSVLVNAETGVCSFMICPLQVLGVAPREGGVKGLGYLMDLAMGWEGQVVPAAAAAGLGGWVIHAKEGSWSVQEAYVELVKIRSVWTGEEVPQKTEAPKVQLNTSPTAGPAQSEALTAPHRVYTAPTKSAAGRMAAMLFFGVLLLGGGVWLGVKQPWAAAEEVEESQVAVVEVKAGVESTAKSAAKPGPKVAAKEKPKPVVDAPKRAKGKKETAQERIDRVSRETSEKAGVDPGKSEKVMPAVFGADDGALMRNWMGEQVTLEAKLFRVRDSREGKARYLEFSDEVGTDVVCVRCKPNEDFDLDGLKALEGKKLRFRGRVEEAKNGRIVVQLETRSQIEVVE